MNVANEIRRSQFHAKCVNVIISLFCPCIIMLSWCFLCVPGRSRFYFITSGDSLRSNRLKSFPIFEWLVYAKKERRHNLLSFLCVGADLSSRAASRQVLSTRMSLTSVFGMGTGGSSSLLTPTIGDPWGIRTPVAGVRGRSLRPLDQRALWCAIGDSNPGPAD